MRTILKDNLKKIIALLLVVSMGMSFDLSAFAQDNSIIEDNTFEQAYPNEIIADVSDSNSTSREDELARERECMPSSPDYLKKFLTYLSLKYPEIGIDPRYGTGGNPDIADHSDDLYKSYNATKMKLQKTYDTIEIDGDDKFEGYSDLTKNMVQFKYLGCFGDSIGSDSEGHSLYSDTVKTLIIRNVDEIRNLYVPASVETLIIENTTLNCYYYKNDSPGFQCGMIPGDLKYCKNLKKLVINNVKFGDNYKRGDAANLLPEITYNCPYEKNYVLNLQDCTNLEELVINVSFTGAEEVQLAIDGGNDNLFANLLAEKCSINPAPGTGYGQVTLYANQKSYLSKYYNSSETVEFKNKQFRFWLLDAIGVDSNNDGVISKDELDAIESLIINDQTAHSAKQTSLSDFQELADIGQMHGLKSLEIDFYDPSGSSNGSRQTLRGIDFPDSLENLTMKNIYWEKDTQTKSHDNADIRLKNLRTLELYNTDVNVGSGGSYFNHPTQIELTDTDGVLQSCMIARTDVESIKLINNSNKKGIKNDDEKQRLRFSATDCPKLTSIEFEGEGYAVEGSLDLSNDIELTHIGIPNEGKTQWTVYGELDSTYAPTNVVLNSCAKLGSDCKEIVIDYDFINGRSINVQTMDTHFDDVHKLTIYRNPRLEHDTAGKVYLSCDKDGWVYNHYKDEEGFVIENRTSFPTIAAFSNGQRMRTSGEGNHNSDSKYTEDTDCWVERWNLVMQPGGYSNNFGNLTFYVVDDSDDRDGNTTKSLRKVFYKGDVYVEWEQQNDADPIIKLPTVKVGEDYKLTGTKLSSTGKSGEVELKLYVYNSEGDKSYIGYQNIKIFKMPDSVELVNDGTKRGSGTKDDPYIVDKNEELKLKARPLVKNGDIVDVDRAGDYAMRDIYWRIKEYDEIPKYTSDSDGYSLYTLDSATKAGISVVREELDDGESEEQYDRRTDNIGENGLKPTYYNHRRFNFDTAGTKFKIVAQIPYKNNDAVITKEVFVEYHSKTLSIDVSNDIVYGKVDFEEAIITINDVYNVKSVNVSIKNPELYDDCFTVERDSSSVEGKEVWKLKVNSSDIVKVKNVINSSNGSITLVINADGKQYEKNIGLSLMYLDASIDISNDIIHGKKGYEETTITINDVYNINSVNVSIKNPELYDDCFIVYRENPNDDGKLVWKLKINNSDISKLKDVINSSNGNITLVINADGQKYEKNISLSSVYPDSGKFWCQEIEDQIYTGKAINPKLNIYYGPFLLVEGKDYTISYKNNVNVESKSAVDTKGNKIGPSVIVNGIGNYSDKQIYYFSILPCSIENTAKVDDIFVAKTNGDIKITPTVVFDGKKLKQGVDFVVSTTTEEKDAITSRKEPNEYPLYVVGKGNYTGFTPFKFIITEKTLASKVTINKIENQKYTGNAITPAVEVIYKVGGKSTNVTDDFTVEFKNNIEIGTASAIIKAKPESELFAGSKTVTFKITGEQIKTAKLGANGKGTIPTKVYDGNPYEPTLDLYVGSVPLIKDVDYSVSYEKNVDVGTATALVTGKGKYTGTQKFTYKITKFDAGKAPSGVITVNGDKDIIVSYEKGGVAPKPTVSMNGVLLTEKKDYTLSYANNKVVAKADAVNSRGKSIAPAITVTFKGNISGKKKVNFEITNKNISEGKITVADKGYSTKPGAWKQSNVTIIDTNGKKLVAGTDYSKTIKYYSDSMCTNEIIADTLDVNTLVYIKVDGINNYDISYIIGSYRISKSDISKAKASIDSQTFTGSEICPAASDIKVWTGSGSNKTDLKAGIDFDIVQDSYANNVNKGTATVTIVGKGDYYGTKVVKYIIVSNKIQW